MRQKIEDLQGNIFEIKGNRDLLKKVPIAFNEKFIFTRDLISDREFTLVEMPKGKWDAIFNLGEAYNYLYLRVELQKIGEKPENDIQKAYLYGKIKKTTKTNGNNQSNGRISSAKGSRNTKKGKGLSH